MALTMVLATDLSIGDVRVVLQGLSLEVNKLCRSRTLSTVGSSAFIHDDYICTKLSFPHEQKKSRRQDSKDKHLTVLGLPRKRKARKE